MFAPGSSRSLRSTSNASRAVDRGGGLAVDFDLLADAEQPQVGRCGAATRFFDFQLAGATGLVDQQDAVAGVVDTGFDADRQRVDAVDHVADRFRLVPDRVHVDRAGVTGRIGNAKIGDAHALRPG